MSTILRPIEPRNGEVHSRRSRVCTFFRVSSRQSLVEPNQSNVTCSSVQSAQIDPFRITQTERASRFPIEIRIRCQQSKESSRSTSKRRNNLRSIEFSLLTTRYARSRWRRGHEYRSWEMRAECRVYSPLSRHRLPSSSSTIARALFLLLSFCSSTLYLACVRYMLHQCASDNPCYCRRTRTYSTNLTVAANGGKINRAFQPSMRVFVEKEKSAADGRSFHSLLFID
jgi:hypothetical protein